RVHQGVIGQGGHPERRRPATAENRGVNARCTTRGEHRRTQPYLVEGGAVGRERALFARTALNEVPHCRIQARLGQTGDVREGQDGRSGIGTQDRHALPPTWKPAKCSAGLIAPRESGRKRRKSYALPMPTSNGKPFNGAVAAKCPQVRARFASS